MEYAGPENVMYNLKMKEKKLRDMENEGLYEWMPSKKWKKALGIANADWMWFWNQWRSEGDAAGADRTGWHP